MRATATATPTDSDAGAALTAWADNPARLEAVARTGLLDAPEDARLQRITRLVTALLGAPVSMVTLIDAERQFFAASDGLPEQLAAMRQSPLEYSFCKHVVADEQRVVIEDTTVDPRTLDNPAVTILGVRSYAGIPLHSADGQTLGTLCVADRRSRVWTAAELEVLEDLAGLASTEVARAEAAHARASHHGDLVASLAHDVRSMVGAISGGARTLAHAERLDDAQRQVLAGVVQRQADELQALMTQLLDSEAVDSGHVGVDTVSTDVGGMVSDVVAAYRLAGHARVAAVVAGHVEGMADAGHLRRCLNNLIDNALRHGGDDVSVTVAGRVEGERVLVTVTDDGPGVPTEQHARIFDRAHQGRQGRGGYGLGLYVVRRLVETMDGRIALGSEPGHGATFTIDLPAA